jgi:hypothetical protein
LHQSIGATRICKIRISDNTSARQIVNKSVNQPIDKLSNQSLGFDRAGSLFSILSSSDNADFENEQLLRKPKKKKKKGKIS